MGCMPLVVPYSSPFLYPLFASGTPIREDHPSPHYPTAIMLFSSNHRLNHLKPGTQRPPPLTLLCQVFGHRDEKSY